MKNNSRKYFVLTIAIISALLASLGTMCDAYRSRTAEISSELKLTLTTDKPVYQRKSEVVFTETFQNQSNKVIQIIDDRCGYGADIAVVRMSDTNLCPSVAATATHNLKPGLRPGARQFLKPGQSFKRKFSAFITNDWQMAFQNHGSAGFTGFSPGAANVKNLPPKFFGCGRIYGLEKPGKYELSAVYMNNGDWSTGDDVMPAMPLWRGRVYSQPIVIEIQN